MDLKLLYVNETRDSVQGSATDLGLILEFERRDGEYDATQGDVDFEQRSGP